MSNRRTKFASQFKRFIQKPFNLEIEEFKLLSYDFFFHQSISVGFSIRYYCKFAYRDFFPEPKFALAEDWMTIFVIKHCTVHRQRVHILSIESFLMTLIAREWGQGLVRQPGSSKCSDGQTHCAYFEFRWKFSSHMQ